MFPIVYEFFYIKTNIVSNHFLSNIGLVSCFVLDHNMGFPISGTKASILELFGTCYISNNTR